MYNYSATVVRVVDGDTIRFDVDLGFNTIIKNHSFRIAKINTPEIRGEERPLGIIAKNYVENLLPVGSRVKLTTYKPDKYGRWLADVELENGKDLGKLLVDNKYAKLYKDTSDFIIEEYPSK